MALGRRLLLAPSGVAALCFYGVLALVSYRLAVVLWAQRPDPAQAALVVVVTAVLLGYLSYRAGTEQLRQRLDAVPVPPEQVPGLHRRLDVVVERMWIDRPQLLLAGLAAPNPLTIGGSREAIVLDRRLLRLLTAAELEALLAHELAHLETNDALIQTLTDNLVQTLTGLVALVVLPVTVILGGFARAFYIADTDLS